MVIHLPDMSFIRTEKISWLERPILCSGSVATLGFTVDGKYVCRSFDTMDEANHWYYLIALAMLDEDVERKGLIGDNAMKEIANLRNYLQLREKWGCPSTENSTTDTVDRK